MAARKRATKKGKGKKPAKRRRVGQGKGGGRPTAYRPEFIRVAKTMFNAGATDREVAEACGVNIATLYRWKHDYKKFCDAFRINLNGAALHRVKVSLLHRAIGYKHDSEEIKVINGKVRRVRTVKEYPPDAKAIGMILYNRDPENWRERMQVSTPPGEAFEVDMHIVPGAPELADEYRARLAAIAADRAVADAARRVGSRGKPGEDEEDPA